jgi:hypothetical protein
MCITYDDVISNGSKCKNVMKKNKMIEKWKGGKFFGNDEVVTIEENKQAKDEKQLKEQQKWKK